MSKHPKHNEIEAYLTGQLSDRDATSFEKAMEIDSALATEVELQKLEHNAMERLLELDLKTKMKTWDKQPPPNPFEEAPEGSTPSKKYNWKFWASIGAITILIIWGISSLSKTETLPSPEEPEIRSNNTSETDNITAPSANEKKPNRPIAKTNSTESSASKKVIPEKKPANKSPKENKYLAIALDKYSTPSNFSSNLRSKDSKDETTNYEKAIRAFQQNKHQDALKILGQSVENEESKALYLRGHIYFKLKNYKKATTEFEKVSANEFAPNALEAEWYLLLTYVTQLPEQKANFETLASKLANDEYSEYREDAQKLLDAVNDVK